MINTQDFKECIKELRMKARLLEGLVLRYREPQNQPVGDAINVNLHEVNANLTLAYRHLEDARMRLGKVIQHCEGGESGYDTRSADQRGPLA